MRKKSSEQITICGDDWANYMCLGYVPLNRQFNPRLKTSSPEMQAPALSQKHEPEAQLHSPTTYTPLPPTRDPLPARPYEQHGGTLER
jgi:hypothetical protein